MKSQTFSFSRITLSLSLVFAITITTSTAQAVEKRSKAASDSVRTTSAATESYSSGSNRFGLGFASAYNLTGSQAALTGWLDLTPKLGIQPLFAIGSTSPFQFAVGSLAKYTIAQSGAGGFHLGGGLALGSSPRTATGGGSLFSNSGSNSSKGFHLGMSALAGIHFALPSTSTIMLHFDGGLNFGVLDGNTDFNTSTVGGLLGASIIYLF